jgi:hypothetical protein
MVPSFANTPIAALAICRWLGSSKLASLIGLLGYGGVAVGRQPER